MGKGRLDRKSTALQRQKSFCARDNSRYEKNIAKVVDPFHLSDDEDESEAPPESPPISFECYNKYLYDLYDKNRGAVREEALQILVDAFERGVLVEYVKTTYLTLLDGCINSLKVTKRKEKNSLEVGYDNEAYLASRAIGLLAITLDDANSSHELMEKSISEISEALKCGTDPFKISVLESLTILTFSGTNVVNEVEKSMEIMFETFQPKSSSEAGPSDRPSSAVLAKAIFSWSFLLTTIASWNISSRLWKESLSIFLNLLEEDDLCVNFAVGFAITAIIQTGSIDKFCTEDGSRDLLKDKIIDQVRKLYEKVKDKGTRGKHRKYQEDFFERLLKRLEATYYHGTTMKVPNKRGTIKISTWSQELQLKFLMHFLGRGFTKHLQDNVLLQDSFDYDSGKKHNPFPKENMKHTLTIMGHKDLTKLRNKQRTSAQDRKYGYGHYTVGYNE